jgi:hypothetical protein
MFENRVLRRILEPKKDEVAGNWGKMRKEKLHSSYSSPNIIRMVKSMKRRWTRNAAYMGEKTEAYKIVVRKPEDKRSSGRYKCK